MNRAQKGILKFSGGIIWGLAAVILCYLFIISIFGTCVMCYTDDHIYYIKDVAGIMLTGLACLIIFLEFLYRRTGWNERYVFMGLAILTLLWAVMMSGLIFLMRLPTTYDQTFVYQAAGDLLKKNFSWWQKDGYLYMHPYQNGLVILESPFTALFGADAYLVMQHLNIFLWIGTMVGTALLSKRFFGKKTAYLTYFLLLIFIPMWSYVTFVYGTVPGLFCSVWSMELACLFLDRKKAGWAAASAFLMALAVMLKTNYEIFAIALILFLLFHAIQEKNIRAVFAAGLTAIMVFAEIRLVPVAIHLMTGADAMSGIPFTAWLAMGLRDSSIAPGWYNRTETLIYQHSAGNVPAMKQAAMASISGSMAQFIRLPDYAVSFFGRKTASLWNSPVFECFTIITKRAVKGTKPLPYWLKDCLFNGGIVNTLLTVFLDVMESVIYFGTVAYLTFDREKKKPENRLFILVFLGGFIFHMFWEGKNQYTVPYYCMLFPCAARGIFLCVRKWRDLRAEAKASQEKGALGKVLRKHIMGTAGGHLLIAMAIVICVIAVIPARFLPTTFKIRGDEREYVYFCKNETEWKAADY